MARKYRKGWYSERHSQVAKAEAKQESIQLTTEKTDTLAVSEAIVKQENDKTESDHNPIVQDSKPHSKTKLFKKRKKISYAEVKRLIMPALVPTDPNDPNSTTKRPPNPDSGANKLIIGIVIALIVVGLIFALRPAYLAASPATRATIILLIILAIFIALTIFAMFHPESVWANILLSIWRIFLIFL